MQFLIGKKVAVLDDVLKGVIVSIDNQTIGVKDSDGMVYFYGQNELVLIEEDQYELSKFSDINNSILNEKLKETKSKTSNFKKSKKVKTASKKEIHSMTNLCIQNLEEINFFKPKEKKPIMLENLRNIFYRMELSAKETRILASVFASLGKKR